MKLRRSILLLEVSRNAIAGYSADSSGRSNRHTARCGATAWLAPDWIGGWPWLRLVGAKPRVDITTLQDRRLTRCFAPTHTI
ncbi:MAG: hypothetical protein HY259_05855, partial [Chloroflexi bacterium]|nr:hypothetical protein [Chloroflexota bacterium]